MTIVFVGDTQVGKTCIISRFKNGTFIINDLPTNYANCINKEIHNNSSQKTVNMLIWDTPGQEKYRKLSPMYCCSAHIIVFVYDITNHESFDLLESLISESRNKAPSDSKIFIVGNKSDLESERQVTTEEGRSFSTEKNAAYFCEVSAKNDTNINELLTKISDIDISNIYIPVETDSNNNFTKCKVVFAGDTKTGKSSITTKFVKGEFNENRSETVGHNTLRKVVTNSNESKIDLEIIDFAGLEMYRSILTLQYETSHIIVFVYDITNRESFENLKSWFSGVKNRYTEAKFIIAGNKADLEDHRKVSTMEGQKFADENDALYFGEVSAKTNLNIDELFLKISDVFSSFFDENSFPRYLKANLLDD